jgi:16S rRNA (adenine1518-N6/adenine1519-N6)-dimethyltransferase
VQTLAEIKALLESRGLSARKSLGQNFLIDKNLVSKLVTAAEVGAGDHVLEVGPGTGTLTEALLEHGCRVAAVELDRGLAALLRDRAVELCERYPGSSLKVIEGDCLAGPGGRTVNPDAMAALQDQRFSLVANLPYNAATPLIVALLTRHFAQCKRMAVTIQREVADRLMAKEGAKEYGTLSVVAQAMARISRIADLPRECFWPRPDVSSAMVSIVPRDAPLTSDAAGLALLCQRLFSKRRKQLGAILGRGHPLPPGVDPAQRPETLTVEQLIDLHGLMGVRPDCESGDEGMDEGRSVG